MSSLSVTASSLSYSAFQALTGNPPGGNSASAAASDPLLAPTDNSTSSPATPSPADALLAATSGANQPAAAGHHRHHGHGGFKQIQDAVTNALQSAQNDPTADPNSLIENAISGVLKSGQATAGQTTASATTAPASDATQNSTAAGATDASTASSFDQLLQSLGITPQQFHSDFLNAIKDAQGGQVNTSAALQSFPSGSLVNVLA